LVRTWKQEVVGFIEVLPWYTPSGTEKNHVKASIRIAGMQAEIRTNHRPNSSLHRYRYTNLFIRALAPVLSQINPTEIVRPFFCKIHFNIILPFITMSPCFEAKIVYELSPVRARPVAMYVGTVLESAPYGL
jgi:hypothetical protein